MDYNRWLENKYNQRQESDNRFISNRTESYSNSPSGLVEESAEETLHRLLQESDKQV